MIAFIRFSVFLMAIGLFSSVAAATAGSEVAYCGGKRYDKFKIADCEEWVADLVASVFSIPWFLCLNLRTCALWTRPFLSIARWKNIEGCSTLRSRHRPRFRSTYNWVKTGLLPLKIVGWMSKTFAILECFERTTDNLISYGIGPSISAYGGTPSECYNVCTKGIVVSKIWTLLSMLSIYADGCWFDSNSLDALASVNRIESQCPTQVRTHSSIVCIGRS